jgi:hypothetical protein
MSVHAKRPISALLEAINPALVFAQIVITRREAHFELRHVDDQETAPASLHSITVEQLRDLAQSTENGEFRPLKSAPHLRQGWVALAKSESDLSRALDHLYPGGLADWFVVQTGQATVTDYDSYTGRQTGMYRNTHKLKGDSAGRMIRACCDKSFCLKQRLWTCPPLKTDSAFEKSILPCLEPCALMLEFARTAWRLEQEDPLSLTFTKMEAESIRSLLHVALNPPTDSTAPSREADFRAVDNPRKLRWILQKIEDSLQA